MRYEFLCARKMPINAVTISKNDSTIFSHTDLKIGMCNLDTFTFNPGVAIFYIAFHNRENSF